MVARSPLILVVDDDASLRAPLEALLQAAGFATAAAENGVHAVRAAAALGPDLVLMDLRMPVLDGWGAMELLRAGAATAAIPVLAVTADAPDPERVRAAGFRALVAKPFRFTALLHEIGAHLRPAVGATAA